MVDDIRTEITIRAQPSKVFQALTSAQELTEVWPIREAVIEGRLGGVITLEGDGFRDEGTITEWRPVEVFEYKYWSTTHGTDRHESNLVSIRYELHPAEDGARLEVLQSNVPNENYRAVMVEAWNDLLRSLKQFIETST